MTTPTPHTLLLTTDDTPGTLSQITRVIAEHPANIRSIESLGRRDEGFVVSLELDRTDRFEQLRDRLAALPVIRRVDEPPPLIAIYGKRVIIIGGGAQVGQVAVGAVSEATTSAANASPWTRFHWSARKRWRPRFGPWPACLAPASSCLPER
jgi:uncharacterized protein with ACT and thioredoxin-like domain